MSRNIWCLSGLGADQRVFANLSLPGYNFRHIPWVKPDRHDDLGCYAQKMAARIDEEAPVILGVSFGGMVGVEISHQRNVSKLLLVSSAKNSTEVPVPGRFIQFIIRHRLLPVGLSKIPNRQTFDLFGAKTKEEREMLMAVLGDTDGDLTKWSMKAILNWQRTDLPDNCTHIHGTADKILRPDHIVPTYWVEGGTHLMIYNRAAEVSALLLRHLDS